MASGIDTLRERLDASQKRFNAAQADVITAEKRFDAAQVDVTLTKNKVSNAAKDSKKKLRMLKQLKIILRIYG